MELCSLEGFQILSLKIFITDFSEPKKGRNLKVRIIMDKDWMYCVYWNRGQGSITLEVTSLGRFSKNLKAFCLITFMFVVLLR